MLILLPPSEWKQSWWEYLNQNSESSQKLLSWNTEQSLEIASSASEKDLKCTGKRYAEAIVLNKITEQWPFLPAIERYSGVMYSAINYQGMSSAWQHFFNQHIGILSGLYGFVRPQDKIANYKLPVNTQLKHFWKEKLTKYLNSIESELIIDLLPWSYHAMIDWKKIQAKVVQVERHNPDGTKVSHGVKKIKGEWLHKLCEQQGEGYDRNEEKIIFEV